MSELGRLLPLLAQLADTGGRRLSLAELAVRDGRSPQHLQRVFRRELGESPLQYRRRISLQRAAAALLVTERKVVELALEAGFDTHEGFTRAFHAHFGESPQKFRACRQDYQTLVHRNRAHLDLASGTAPCVGLYRRSLTTTSETSKQQPHQKPAMSYEIVEKQLSATAFLYIARQCKQEEIAATLGPALGTVFQHATAKAIPFAGPPTVRYTSFGPGLVSFEAGLPIAAAAEPTGEIEVGELPGGPTITTVHKGPYDKLAAAHEAIQAWMTEHQRKPSGAPWEVYITDPGEVPNPEDWITEIFWPA